MANVVVIGSGGREDALAISLAKSDLVRSVRVSPGNGGTGRGEQSDKIVRIRSMEVYDLIPFCHRADIDLVIIGPELPLVFGLADRLTKAGIKCFGPSKMAARMEGSKAFAKEFMKRRGIPTASHATVRTLEEAQSVLESSKTPVVLKASGLAGGKGVLIPSRDKSPKEDPEAYRLALDQLFTKKEFGAAAKEVVIEEHMEGEEVSILAISDGYSLRTFPPCQDHKYAFDGDQGPMTGGMGAYCPAPVVDSVLAQEIERTVLRPSIDGMRHEGYPFLGCLFVGLMITKDGPKVLEYNVRFGDPETEAVLQLLESDLYSLFLATVERRLDSVPLTFNSGYATCIILASPGYPGAYPKDLPVRLTDKIPSTTTILHAGTAKLSDGTLVTSGGRVFAVVGTGKSMRESVDNAYTGIEFVQFDGKQFRTDIGHRALTRPAKAKSNGLSYAAAGVSIDAGNSFVENIKSVVGSTKRPGADSKIGGFGGAFDLAASGWFPTGSNHEDDTVLLGATDGVGTKLILAQKMKKHDTIGIDNVAMNVNDLIVQGAEPLFFLDYFACSKLTVELATDVVKGVADGCKMSGAALIGGETAEMPGLYEGDDYDLAGFTVGAVKRGQILPRTKDLREGDVILGIASAGCHSNGFSLVRKIVEKSGLSYEDPCPWDEGWSLGLNLLTPTRIYVKSLLPLVRADQIKAMAHITGGGLVDNVPRALPKHLSAHIDVRKWQLPKVFSWLKSVGEVESFEMARTFNCGIGMVLIVAESEVKGLMKTLKEVGETVYEIGNLAGRAAKDDEGCLLTGLDSW